MFHKQHPMLSPSSLLHFNVDGKRPHGRLKQRWQDNTCRPEKCPVGHRCCVWSCKIEFVDLKSDPGGNTLR